ncbi:hypothetical protein AB9K35_19270 [Leisingera sp. XS_AS12]|uniref:hypothetical protein n=1 Tax=Leisingera sp. XS_AS12 TaxID=3241294 RepID=UPI003517065C
MLTLQSLLNPEQEICTEHNLYFRTEGGFGFSQSSGHLFLDHNALARFDTYFNLFSLEKWHSACHLDGLFAEFRGQGRVEIRIIQAFANRSWEICFCEITELDPQSPFVADLSTCLETGGNGVLFAEVKALDENGATLMGGRFATNLSALPEVLPKLAVSITTFKREREVQHTVARLEDFLTDFAYGDQIRVQVVDNGQSADITATPNIIPYPNRNLGGAGGFARGLLEAEEDGYSHCLFMDDDAAFHMENIARAYTFLALARDSRTALAGAMINNSHKWCMWENGALFDGSCHPLYNGADLRDPAQVRGIEFSSTHTAPPTLYGGWWFFAFPIAHVTHHPFPFFVRGDDISFSLANDFRIFTLNGVVSFQDDFTEKESPQTLYLDLRNHLIHHLVFDKLERSPLGTAKIAIRFMLRSLLRFKYESAEAQLLAWQDVMKGPKFFDENIDMSQRRADIKALMKDEVWQDAAEAPAPGRARFSRLPRRLRHYLGLFTLNGHLVPFWKTIGDRMQLDIGDRGLVFPAFGGARLTYFNTRKDKAYTVTQSKRRFFSLAWRMTQTLSEFYRNYDSLKQAYRQGYADMANKGYWEKTLKPEQAA